MVQSEPLPLEVAIATESLLVPSLSHAQSFPESDTLLNLLAKNSWRSCQELAPNSAVPQVGVMVSPEGRPNFPLSVLDGSVVPQRRRSPSILRAIAGTGKPFRAEIGSALLWRTNP